MDLPARKSVPFLQRWKEEWAVLTKARLTFLVLCTTLAGYAMASTHPWDWWQLLHTLLGTALVAASAASFNQLMEREWDARMLRTADRPLPTGKLHPDEVLIFSFVTAIGGLIYLSVIVNFLAGVIAAITLGSYLYIYTPLKRYTTLNTIVGAVPGALPPVLGTVAASGKFDQISFLRFTIVFLWQIPHFLAIAWRCREDYARAGFKMLPSEDPSGLKTGWQSLFYVTALLPVSVWPYGLHLCGQIYLWGALLLGFAFFYAAVCFLSERNEKNSKLLFWASITYLPLLLLLMTLDANHN